jgi:hypothetical protein
MIARSAGQQNASYSVTPIGSRGTRRFATNGMDPAYSGMAIW